MNIVVRKETEKDYSICELVTDKAFEKEEHSDHREQYLVAKLRKSEEFIPELSLVAEIEGKIVGHIMFTKLYIKSDERTEISLALAPVSVLPEYQNKGVGTKLVTEGLEKAKLLGYKSAIVLGHMNFYPRFGFKPASIWGVKAPFDVADDYFMALELESGGLNGANGTVIYAKEFFEK